MRPLRFDLVFFAFPLLFLDLIFIGLSGWWCKGREVWQLNQLLISQGTEDCLRKLKELNSNIVIIFFILSQVYG